MRVKTCTRCGQTKPLCQFPPVRRSEPEKLQSWCRSCFAEAGARHYRNNIDRERARLYRSNGRRRAESQRRVLEYLLAHPCVDCGEADVVVLQFDHLRDKRFDISAMISSGASWHRIEAEIAKCVVRCANCHHRKTANERGYRKLQATPTATVKSRRVARPVQICRSCTSDYNREWWAKNRVVQMPRIPRNRARRDRQLSSGFGTSSSTMRVLIAEKQTWLCSTSITFATRCVKYQRCGEGSGRGKRSNWKSRNVRCASQIVRRGRRHENREVTG